MHETRARQEEEEEKEWEERMRLEGWRAMPINHTLERTCVCVWGGQARQNSAKPSQARAREARASKRNALVAVRTHETSVVCSRKD